MRFAYIDSQGNEVQIPSEDALRLRVELGAIVDSTSFFDGEGGGWAPARDHEVYRRIRRDLAVDSGLAPPPPPPPEEPRDTDAGIAGGDGGFERVIDFDAPAAQFENDAFQPALESVQLPPEHEVGPDPGALDAFDGFEGFEGFGSLDLEEQDSVEPRASTPAPESPSPSFDDATQPPESESESDDPWTVPGRDPWAPEVVEEERPDSMEGVGFGDEPAPPAATGAHPFDADEEMPDWLRNDPEFGTDSAQVAPDSAATPAFPTREEVRERYEQDLEKPPAPSGGAGRTPPRRPVTRVGASSRARMYLLGTVALAVVAAGGWYLVKGADAGPSSGEAAAIELPAISPTLLPVATRASQRAHLATVLALASDPARDGVPDEPDGDWLAGRYMAGAGDYTPVRLYWEAMGRYVQVMRAREGELFATELAAALDTVPLAPDDRRQVEARSIAGFAAAAPERDAVYAQLRAVADAALQLHLFLEQNQAEIDYDPIDSGLSRDPVLEAVPATEELGDEMWNRVADITSALDALGFLDKVTTDQLLEVFFDKLEAVEVR